MRLGLGSTASGSAVISQIVLKTATRPRRVDGMEVAGQVFKRDGLRAVWWNRSYLVWFAIAAVSMMAGSVVVIFLGVRHPVASQMSFLQIVVVIWLLSSFSEEVYVRGLVQSWVADRDDVNRINSAFEASIVSSALLFAAMHGTLMWSPLVSKGVWRSFCRRLGVGLACAVLRARSKSLWPAIACHVIGNVAGIPGGILGVVLYRLVYGRLPEFLSGG